MKKKTASDDLKKDLDLGILAVNRKFAEISNTRNKLKKVFIADLILITMFDKACLIYIKRKMIGLG